MTANINNNDVNNEKVTNKMIGGIKDDTRDI